MLDTLDRGTVPLQHLPDLGNHAVIELRSHQLGPSLLGQQVLDSTQLLQFTLVEDRDAVADVLYVGQQVAAHHDRLALSTQLQDQVLHVAGT